MGRGGTKWGEVGRNGELSHRALTSPAFLLLLIFMNPMPNSAPIFSSEFRHALDPKNRVTVPSRWRCTDADEFYLMVDRSGTFLRAMPPAQFRAVGEKVEARSDISAKKKQDFLDLFYSQALLVLVDKQGRLLVPEALGKAVGLSGEVLLAGVRDTFQIWNPEAWVATKQTKTSNFHEVADELGL